MLIPLNDIILIYEKMKELLNIDYVSVVIFTGVDIDSLCTLKILSNYLKSESIHYQIYPVTNYTELQDRIQKSKTYQKVRLFMFINCGGFIDLTQKWFISGDNAENATVFLFDVNKPLNHKNIQSHSVFILDDQHSELDKRLTAQDLHKLQQIQEFDLNDLQHEEEKGEIDIQDQNDSSPKRQSHYLISTKLKKHKELLQKKISNYYENSFFSLPTSYCMYRFVRQLNRANNYSLWYAIVGMTSMYLQNSISKQVLQTLTSFYRSDMVRFNPQNNERRQKGQIFTKKGYQFPLLNNWSLYDSMMNSSYLMMKLALWSDRGVKKLHEILTKIGISLIESKQQYKYMLKQSRQSLEQNIFTIAQQYQLIQITYESFMKQIDTSSAYMASDFYYIITSVLQKPLQKGSLQQLDQHRVVCFWEAYSILEGSQEMIRNVIQQYKQTSLVIGREVKDIIERDNIINMKIVKFTNIRCDTKQKRMFEHPSTLIRFSYLLMGIQRQRKKDHRSNPFISSLFDAEKGICTVVGITPEYRNALGNRFNEIANKLHLDVKHDKFMSNILILPKDSLLEFVKEVDSLVFNKLK